MFAGSPAVALPSLRVVQEWAAHLRVVSQPDRPVGRRADVTPTAVSTWALDNGLDLVRPTSATELRHAVADFQPDLGITVAYGRILSPEVLALPRHGWWNVHFSLLPAWRGAAPVQHALWAGDESTGVTVFQLDEGVDTGPILIQRSYPIPASHTAGQVLTDLAELGAEALTEALERWDGGSLRPSPQHGEASHAPKMTRQDARLVWGEDTDGVVRRFRAVTPEPGAWSEGPGGQPVKILHLEPHPGPSSVAGRPGSLVLENGRVLCGTGDGVVAIGEVVPAGKRAMSAVDWWRGLPPGVTLG